MSGTFTLKFTIFALTMNNGFLIDSFGDEEIQKLPFFWRLFFLPSGHIGNLTASCAFVHTKIKIFACTKTIFAYFVGRTIFKNVKT